MPAHLTPQEAVIRYKRRPADCDIVVVILAGRLGTHLSLDALKRPDGSAYLSGTEWEFEDAWNASPRPDILVYRRMDIPPIDVRDPNRDERSPPIQTGRAVLRALQEPRRLMEKQLPGIRRRR